MTYKRRWKQLSAPEWDSYVSLPLLYGQPPLQVRLEFSDQVIVGALVGRSVGNGIFATYTVRTRFGDLQFGSDDPAENPNAWYIQRDEYVDADELEVGSIVLDIHAARHVKIGPDQWVELSWSAQPHDGSLVRASKELPPMQKVIYRSE